MKFISKNSNLRVVLRPGLPANLMAGQAAQPGIYVKFQDGIVKIEDEDTITLMKMHPGYNYDFISSEESESDPYEYTRSEIEPVHHIAEIKYGHVEKAVSSPTKTKINPELQALLKEQAMAMATEMVKQMLPGAVEETIKQLTARHKDDKAVEEAPKEEVPVAKPKAPAKGNKKEQEAPKEE